MTTKTATQPRTPFEAGVDSNSICQALAKWFIEHPTVKVDWMSLVSDMTWIVNYTVISEYKGNLKDMIVSVQNNGTTLSSYYLLTKTQCWAWWDHDCQTFLRCFFTRRGMGLECEWRTISKLQATRLVNKWDKILSQGE
jgi:hypothetical protein